MIARFDGRCGICEETIHAGDEIVEVEGEWVHASPCAEEWLDEEDG